MKLAIASTTFLFAMMAAQAAVLSVAPATDVNLVKRAPNGDGDDEQSAVDEQSSLDQASQSTMTSQSSSEPTFQSTMTSQSSSDPTSQSTMTSQSSSDPTSQPHLTELELELERKLDLEYELELEHKYERERELEFERQRIEESLKVNYGEMNKLRQSADSKHEKISKLKEIIDEFERNYDSETSYAFSDIDAVIAKLKKKLADLEEQLEKITEKYNEKLVTCIGLRNAQHKAKSDRYYKHLQDQKEEVF
ncbi:hypothetical protein BASA50_010477 [Batrachochytrium salamandrivorans]|uniref:Uncharacterized protein n=1 Tax=Batrachochytrium salamandrivorans TaxID=1357716 RepID=A0ABQ8F127_9FUNG|nr:hypothetical protein BASA62_009723 [Batrachochytrium salamandrivorans]KAH6570896.1 hypothetical protein BASA60_007503 [Batrachochytrium salamandrivorans]KAH6587386.1 hypothetical protein BASA61_006316 [Batrachochytrium salamandrivorans]KAH6588771.1 hypothetical protein BASA50_010477 [Batrachochytrium salamandrivorans]KAH9272732.1 hypothetical protein BASA83_004934 [Batrachochytrium salamandrivorans]